MSKSSDEYLFDTYLQEYQKHRDEIQNRIGLQNGMAQRGMALTGLAVTLLATLFTFFMKDYGTSQGTATAPDSIHLFLAVCIPVLFTHGVLILLTIATWIYQLSMMFRILRYWNWIVAEKLEPLIAKSEEAFLWDRVTNPPWDLPLDNKLIMYFQPLFLYALSLFSLLGFLIALIWQPPSEVATFATIRAFGFVGFPVLAVFLLAIAIIHRKVVSKTEASKNVTFQQTDVANSQIT